MTTRDDDKQLNAVEDRRLFLKAGVAALVSGGLGSKALDALAQTTPLAITHGTVTGNVTDRGALVWARASAEGRMYVEFWSDTHHGRTQRRTTRMRVDGGSDFIGQFELDDLEPDSSYFYRVLAERGVERAESAIATFHTAPHPHRAQPVRFTWGGDVGQGLANRPPFPAFASMAAETPDFFVFNGDTIYGDGNTPIGPGATTVPGFWAKYKENRVDPLFQAFARQTPMIVNWDDHEVDNDYRGLDPALPEGQLGVGRQAFFDYWPIRAKLPDTWRKLRWGREVEVFVLDCRQFSDPLDTPDGPEKTMLGVQQRRWLQRAVEESDARWKVLITSCPLSILRSANPPQDDWVSYRARIGHAARVLAQEPRQEPRVAHCRCALGTGDRVPGVWDVGVRRLPDRRQSARGRHAVVAHVRTDRTLSRPKLAFLRERRRRSALAYHDGRSQVAGWHAASPHSDTRHLTAGLPQDSFRQPYAFSSP